MYGKGDFMEESTFNTWERAIRIADNVSPERRQEDRLKIRGRSAFEAGFKYCQQQIIQALRQAQSEEIKSRIGK